MVQWQFPSEFSACVQSLSQLLDPRLRQRLEHILLGVLFAQGRRTVTSWLRAIDAGREFKRYYYFLGSLGRNPGWVAAYLLGLVYSRVQPGQRVVVAIDDSPTKRYGPDVEGAGIHHNPTPGPSGQKHLYGHVWVTLALLAQHPQWGTIALPLLASLYIRAVDVKLLPCSYRWKFHTKLEQAAQLVQWLAASVKSRGKMLWVVADGAYAKRPFVQSVKNAGAVLISRLRKDAALCSVPEQPPAGQRRRGRPRIYGEQRISLAKRAGQKGGWQSLEVTLYRHTVVKRIKTFLATYYPACGLIRVVLVREETGWIAFFSTDPNATAAEILQSVANRGAIEQAFHDVKEVHGAGQQQLRNVWANVAAWNVCLWVYTLVELWAWDRSHADLCDRSARPWDDPQRRPSHADRCTSLRRCCLEHHYSRIATAASCNRKIRDLIQQLARRVA